MEVPPFLPKEPVLSTERRAEVLEDEDVLMLGAPGGIPRLLQVVRAVMDILSRKDSAYAAMCTLAWKCDATSRGREGPSRGVKSIRVSAAGRIRQILRTSSRKNGMKMP